MLIDVFSDYYIRKGVGVWDKYLWKFKVLSCMK